MLRSVKVTAKSSFGKSTTYELEVEGATYGCCRKRWDDFEEIYDSLQLTHPNILKVIEFPPYNTRKDLSKKEAVEENRQGLETLIQRMLDVPEIAADAGFITFLQISEDIGPATRPPEAPSESLRDRPGPTPFNVAQSESRGDYDDDADNLDDNEGGQTFKHSPGAGPVAGDGRGALEPCGTVWLGNGDFPAP